MRVLIVLDHRNLLSYGSTIAIVETLSNTPGVETHVASAGYEPNVHFFAAPEVGPLHTRIADENFNYKNRLIIDRWIAGSSIVSIDDFAGIVMRFDPLEAAPSRYHVGDDPYVSGVVRRMRALQDRVPIINRPQGIIQSADKKFLARFPEFVPGAKVCDDVDDILLHLESNRSIVLKTSFGTGGQGIVRVDRPGWIRNRKGIVMKGNERCRFGPNDAGFAEFIEGEIGFPCLAVTYQPRVATHGDKRVAVFDGQIIGSVLRKPTAGNWIANKAQGGLLEGVEADDDEIAIIRTLDPILKEMGVLFYGIDTLVDPNGRRVLSEINTTSPNGLLQIENYSRPGVLKELAELMAAHFAK